MCASKLHAGDEKFHPIYRHRFWFQFLVVQSLSRVLVTLGDPMGCSISGFPVLHHLLKLAHTHVHWVSDAIQLCHPLSSPFPLALSFPASGSFLKSHLFASGGQSTGASASAPVLFFFFLLYNIVLVLPYINMHPPWVYTCSPSWTPFPSPSP